jgi:hypothetical protein
MWDSDGSRNNAQHKAWRRDVLDRDAWSCRLRHSGCLGTANEAHHLVRPAIRPDLEYDVDNGVAACAPCHKVETQKQATAARRASHASARRPREHHPGLA